MSHFATYQAAALPSPGKKGLLKQLDNDYVEIIIGAVAAQGNGGWIYDEKTAIQYMQNNPEFLEMMRLRRMRSEWGHPVRQPGMSDQEWFARINTIYEPNWSSHIRKIHLSSNTLKDAGGRAVIAIIGEVTPCGPHASDFRRCLENPDEDVNYSIRSFASKNFATGRKHIQKIVTFDSVWNPGIKEISKFNTPSLEAADIRLMLDQTEFHLDSLRAGFTSPELASMESTNEMIKIIDSFTVNHRVSVPVSKRYAWGQA